MCTLIGARSASSDKRSAAMNDDRKYLIQAGDRLPGNAEATHAASTQDRLLSQAMGLERLSIVEQHLPHGRELTLPGSLEEEFIYVLRGHGLLSSDGSPADLGPGDFIGLPAGGASQKLSNPFTEDLIVLRGRGVHGPGR